MSMDRISSEHCRAICDEVGQRLRQYIDRTSDTPPPKLLELIRKFEVRELEAPSLVPALEDMAASAPDFATA
jgi:hypothetical protein